MRGLSSSLSLVLARCGLVASIPLGSGCLLDYYVGDFDTGLPPVHTVRIDLDNDGYTTDEGDCDDADASRSPGIPDHCDGYDNDCNGLIDQGNSDLHACDTYQFFQQRMLADVLIVLDISESMFPYWTPAADGALEMLEHLVGKGRETHVGLITTDTETEIGSGRLVEWEGRRYLTGDDSYPTAAFWLKQAMIDRLPALDIKEGVRSAIEASLTEHLDGWNSGFYRSEADLAVVIFSNADDTTEPDNTTFLTQLQDFVGPLGDTTRIYTIAPYGPPDLPTEAACDQLPRADQLLALAENSIGMTHNLCSLDYTGFLSGVGQDIANKSLSTEMTLDRQAIPTSISISIIEGQTEYPWAGEISLSVDGQTLYFITPLPVGSEAIIRYRIALPE